MPRARTCPDCQIAMHFLLVAPRGKELELDRCVQCGSVWFDAGEVDQLAGRALPFEAFDHEAERNCPVCDQPMQAGVLKQAVPVERCGSCRGYFLDADDLQLLKLKLTDRPKSKALVNGFVCARCGGRFPYSDGNATTRGLVCKTCVVNPVETHLAQGERTGTGALFRLDNASNNDSLAGMFDWLFLL